MKRKWKWQSDLEQRCPGGAPGKHLTAAAHIKAMQIATEFNLVLHVCRGKLHAGCVRECHVLVGESADIQDL